jgi:hypothetical protein
VALRENAASAPQKENAILSHNVYFSLKDNSPAARKKLIAVCKKYLTGHEGEVFFAAGALAETLKRDFNDLAFDVALHIVFRDMAAHEEFQNAPRRRQFVDENQDNW